MGRVRERAMFKRVECLGLGWRGCGGGGGGWWRKWKVVEGGGWRMWKEVEGVEDLRVVEEVEGGRGGGGW